MGKEIDLLVNYPKTKRNLDSVLHRKQRLIVLLPDRLAGIFLMAKGAMGMGGLITCPDSGNRSFQPSGITGS